MAATAACSTAAASSARATTLVFADDRSPRADVAWLWVCSHPWDGWNVEVVTASPPHWEHAGPDTVLHVWSPTPPRTLFAESHLTKITYLTAAADPRELLLRPAGLTVLGEHGPGLGKSLHLTSTVDWLLRRPLGAMVVARHGLPSKRVLICHDGSRHADAALDAFMRLPWAAGCQLMVLSAQTALVDADGAHARASAQLGFAGLSAERMIGAGDPTIAIKRAIREVEPDLIVLGTAGRSRLERLAVGSTATAIARDATCSVLVARDVTANDLEVDEARA